MFGSFSFFLLSPFFGGVLSLFGGVVRHALDPTNTGSIFHFPCNAVRTLQVDTPAPKDIIICTTMYMDNFLPHFHRHGFENHRLHPPLPLPHTYTYTHISTHTHRCRPAAGFKTKTPGQKVEDTRAGVPVNHCFRYQAWRNGRSARGAHYRRKSVDGRPNVTAVARDLRT